MIEINVPGRGILCIKYLVLDYNGTIALDGDLAEHIKERINLLAERLDVYIITADTHGRCSKGCQGLSAKLHILSKPLGGPEKMDFVEQLGAVNVAAIGNGANDALMLEKAGLGIAVIGSEGTAVKSVLAADVVVTNIINAFDLLLKPKRLIATLRE
ncbi:HAD family hydrolase [Desulfofarcimen acetoxidans DSM 771]|uniref:HAD family hydrolase n=1 Tax=Desulfofarcimen acetoxidans (strain ATCC 49208 / DSM 771 / KCTC 5769 / VKM B-1644 / 5575) TaxID=485916 RepID=C8W1X4_DESAS|nr:HAD hydrolase family protein [Desulfofarcimen acetoxidans]ACV63595.1 HAD family hydrolase [Desulfofarcimen acetoxidans DSM 771]